MFLDSAQRVVFVECDHFLFFLFHIFHIGSIGHQIVLKSIGIEFVDEEIASVEFFVIGDLFLHLNLECVVFPMCPFGFLMIDIVYFIQMVYSDRKSVV